MKKQLLFYMDLLFSEKKRMVSLVGVTLLYIAIGCIWFHRNQILVLLSSVFYATIITYTDTTILSCHVNKNHINVSNYSILRYYPAKKRHLSLGKTIIVIGGLFLVEVITILTFCLSSAIFHKSITISEIVPYLLFEFCAVALASSVSALTSFMGSFFYMGRIIYSTILGGFVGGFTSMGRDDIFRISNHTILTIFLIFSGIWLCCEMITLYIASRFSV